MSGKKIVLKKFLYIVAFKNEVFGKPDFGQKKPDPNVREVQKTLMIGGDHDKILFVMWVNVEIKKMCKTGRFRAKPDPGQFLSWKNLNQKISHLL